MAFYTDIAKPARDRALKQIQARSSRWSMSEEEEDAVSSTLPLASTVAPPTSFEAPEETPEPSYAPTPASQPMSQAEMIEASRTYKEPAPGSIAERYGLEQRDTLPLATGQDVIDQPVVEEEPPPVYDPRGREKRMGATAEEAATSGMEGQVVELTPAMAQNEQLISRLAERGVEVKEVPTFSSEGAGRRALMGLGVAADVIGSGLELFTETAWESVKFANYPSKENIPTLYTDGVVATIEQHRKRHIAAQIGLGIVFDPFLLGAAFKIPAKASGTVIRANVKAQLVELVENNAADLSARQIDDVVNDIVEQIDAGNLTGRERDRYYQNNNPLGNLDDPDLAFGADELQPVGAGREPVGAAYRVPPEEAAGRYIQQEEASIIRGQQRIDEMKAEVAQFFGPNPEANPNPSIRASFANRQGEIRAAEEALQRASDELQLLRAEEAAAPSPAAVPTPVAAADTGLAGMVNLEGPRWVGEGDRLKLINAPPGTVLTSDDLFDIRNVAKPGRKDNWKAFYKGTDEEVSFKGPTPKYIRDRETLDKAAEVWAARMTDSLAQQATPPPAAAAPTPVAAADEVVAPRFVESSKPRYRDATPEFESPLDKALYIVAKTGKLSAKDEDFMEFAMDATGLSRAEVRAAGKEIRAAMKGMYDEGADTFRVPRQYDAPRVGREVVEETPAPRPRAATPEAAAAPTPTARPSTEALRTPGIPPTPMARVANFVDEPNYQFTPDNVIQDMSSQGGRDMVVVDVPNHGPQAFYRSTGKNSRKPGEWLPFDGISPIRGGWFDKSRFTGNELSEDMMRYGTPELKEMSERLTSMDIPEGQVIASQRDINAWLNTTESLGQNTFADNLEKAIPTNITGDGPTPAARRAADEGIPQEPAPDIGDAGRGVDDGPPPPRDTDGEEFYDEFGEPIDEPKSPKAYHALDQAQELQNLDAPGAFGKFLDMLPGPSQIQHYLRPANKIASFIMNSFIAEGGVRARLLTEMFAERESVLYPALREHFGKESLAGAKLPDISFIGTADEYVEEIGNTLLDIAQRPHLYGLSQGQQEALAAWQAYQTKFMREIIDGYGVKADVFEVPDGAVFLSNVNVDDDLLEALDITASQAIGRGRNKHRYFNTAADRYRSMEKKLDEAVIDKRLEMEQNLGRVLSDAEVATLRETLQAERKIKFKAVTNILELQAGMDVWKARAASKETFKIGSQGKTRTQVLEELHPDLKKRRDRVARDLKAMAAQITTAERQLIAEAGALRRSETLLGQTDKRLQPILDRIDELESLGKEGWGPELSYLSGQARELSRNLRILEQQGINIGERGAAGVTKLMTLNRRLDLIADQLETIRARYTAADIGDYQLVTEGGLYRYYHAKDAKVIRDLNKVSDSMIVRVLEEVRGTAFAGDLSPLLGVQMPLAFMANPLGVVRSLVGAVADSAKSKDVFRSFRTTTLADVVSDDLDGWADFAFYSGRGITAGTPDEFVGGLLRFLPGFNKLNESMYSVVLRQTKALYDQQLSILMKQGVSIEEAKATAADLALKVVPMWSPRRLGLSPGREAAIRSGVTSISFLTKPAELMATASMGFAKLLTKQTLTAQERLAMRVVATMGATWMSLSVSSAVLDAKAKGRDPWQAAKDAMTPNSGSFGTVKLVGTEMSIPVGGPIRGVVQAVTPQMVDINGVKIPVPFAGMPKFFMNRMTPFLRTQLAIAMDRDFYGGKVTGYLKDKESSLQGKWLRGLAYEVEGMMPLTVGAAMGGVRRGLSDATQPMIDAVEIVKDSMSQFGGFNLFVETPYTKGDYAAQKWAKENGIRGYREELPDGTLSEGVEIKRRGDLSPRDEQRFMDEVEDIQKDIDKHIKRMALQKVDWAVTTYEAQETKIKYAQQQEADDKALKLYIQLGPQPNHDDGTIKTLNPEHWRNNRRERMLTLATERERIYKDLNTKDPKTATDRYYQQFDIIKEKHLDEMTDAAWEELERWVVSQSEYDQKWIEENTQLHALTPMVQEYKNDQKLLEGYWQLEEDFLEHIRVNHVDGLAKGAEVVERFRRYRDAPDHSKHLHGMEDINEKLGRLKKAYRVKNGTLASIMAGEKGDPEKGKRVDITLAKWGYKGTPISEEAKKYLVYPTPMTPDGYNQPIGSTQPQPLQMQPTPSNTGSFMDSLLGGAPTQVGVAPGPAPMPTPSNTGSFMDSLLAGAR